MFLQAVLVVGGSVLFAVGGVNIVRRFMQGRAVEGHNDTLVPMFLTAGTIYAVLIAFVTVAVWEQFGAAKDNVADEASLLTTMYRQTNGMGADEQKQMRDYLRSYAEAVVNDEWKLQLTGGASPIARKAVGDIYRAWGTMTPAVANSAINAEFLKNFSALTSDRNKRTLASADQLPFIFWAILFGGGAVVVGMTFLLYMDRVWPQAVMAGIMAGLIGVLLFVIMVLNQPFTGGLALDPGPFEHSLSVFDSVDQGN